MAKLALLAALALIGCTSPTKPGPADCPPGFERTGALVYPSGMVVSVCQEITFSPVKV